jgi:pimeloyl-ACP methyl ester carboxylesterase
MTQGHVMVPHQRRQVRGLDDSSRDAGYPAAPTLVLRHGYPSSSFMSRRLMPASEDQLHLIAADHPGFGDSDGCCAEGLAHLPPCGWM